MKRLTLITIFLLCFVVANAQTTPEEYNYLLYGKLNVDLPGHTLKAVSDPLIINFSDAARSTVIYELFRDNQTKPCAILISYQTGVPGSFALHTVKRFFNRNNEGLPGQVKADL